MPGTPYPQEGSVGTAVGPLPVSMASQAPATAGGSVFLFPRVVGARGAADLWAQNIGPVKLQWGEYRGSAQAAPVPTPLVMGVGAGRHPNPQSSTVVSCLTLLPPCPDTF